MAVVVLLLTGLVSLAVGLLLSSTIWLIVSLAASVLAGLLLYRNRDQLQALRQTGHGTPDTAAPADPDTRVWVVDGRPRYHSEDCAIIRDLSAEPIPIGQADEDGFMACSLCEPAAGASVAQPATRSGRRRAHR